MIQEVLGAIAEFESKGGEFALNGNRVRLEYPAEQRDNLFRIIATLRTHRDEVATLIRERLGILAPTECPPLPPGVRLLRYAPKAPPVALQPCSIVTDVNKFIGAYLADLGWRLKYPKTYGCPPLPDILAKLAGVGVELELVGESGETK